VVAGVQKVVEGVADAAAAAAARITAASTFEPCFICRLLALSAELGAARTDCSRRAEPPRRPLNPPFAAGKGADCADCAGARQGAALAPIRIRASVRAFASRRRAEIEQAAARGDGAQVAAVEAANAAFARAHAQPTPEGATP
jgi:hypothetical protein